MPLYRHDPANETTTYFNLVTGDYWVKINPPFPSLAGKIEIH